MQLSSGSGRVPQTADSPRSRNIDDDLPVIAAVLLWAIAYKTA